MNVTTLDDLLTVIRPLAPTARVEENADGQVVIYTGLRQRPVLVPFAAEPEPAVYGWLPPDTAITTDFYEVKVVMGRSISDDEMATAAGCIAYAFRQHLRGERAGRPERVNETTFTFYYDITKSRSDDWAQHFDDALEDADDYCRHGTPERKDRTRLINGVGFGVREFWFR